MRIVVMAALPQEISGAISYFKAVKGAGNHAFKLYLAADSVSQIIFVITGMGMIKAREAIEFIEKAYTPDLVISAGYAGALYKDAAGGELLNGMSFMRYPVSGDVIEAENGKSLIDKVRESLAIKDAAVITLSGLERKSAVVAQLPKDILNPVCDMETYAIASFCEETKVPFISLRAVTDLADQDIPKEVADLVDADGQYSALKAAGLVLRKPLLLPLLISLGINSARASRQLEKAVITLINSVDH